MFLGKIPTTLVVYRSSEVALAIPIYGISVDEQYLRYWLLSFVFAIYSPKIDAKLQI